MSLSPTVCAHPKQLITPVSWEHGRQRNESNGRETRRQVLKVAHFARQRIQPSQVTVVRKGPARSKET